MLSQKYIFWKFAARNFSLNSCNKNSDLYIASDEEIYG